MLDERIYQNYIGILKEEMIPAMDVQNRSHWHMEQPEHEKFWEKNRNISLQNAVETL